ncbi:uncharacterized protein LOC123320435 [Coccinella septempunctata]|uniref:uncharacterized protein LOC123320435 n=1 Tax=Coccinella septempunctata TaxID=41139 RepID=UPI001D084424|nr:uncharacterized protein LOC123320435 [Coccinella septempunctata]
MNLIFHLVANDGDTIFQVMQNFQLEYPVISRNYLGKNRLQHAQISGPNIYMVNVDKLPAEDFLEKLEREYHNSRVRFIFIGRHFQESDVNILIEKYVVNFLFIKYPTGEILTTFPYTSGHLRNFSTNLEQIGYCREGELFMDGEVFRNKLPKSWDNFSMSLLYRHDEPFTIDPRGQRKGIEIDLLDIILGRMGIKSKYTNVRHISSTMILLLKFFHKFDIGFGNEVPLANTANEYTIPYSCHALSWYVPKSGILPKWKLIFNTFSVNLCWLWGLLLLFFSVFWYLVYIALKDQRHFSYFFNKIWIIISFVLEQPGNYLSDFTTIIILLFMILQSSLILNVLYKAKYTSLLSTVNYYGEINSLEKIMENNLKMGLTRFLIRIYQTTPSVKKYLEENFVECDIDMKCLFRTALKRDIAVLAAERKVNFFQRSFTDEDGSPYLNKIMPPALTYCNSFIFPKGHPLFPSINKFLSHLLDHGIVDKVISSYENLYFNGIYVNQQVKLNFDHVKAAFIVLLVGNSAALFIFVIENLMLQKIFKRENNGYV